MSIYSFFVTYEDQEPELGENVSRNLIPRRFQLVQQGAGERELLEGWTCGESRAGGRAAGNGTGASLSPVPAPSSICIWVMML